MRWSGSALQRARSARRGRGAGAGRGDGPRRGPETRGCGRGARRGRGCDAACARGVRWRRPSGRDLLVVSLRAARRRADFARGLAATSPGVGRDGAAEDGLGLGRAPAAADRQVGRADAAARAVGEEALDAPVLERVEGDRGEPAAGAQQLPRQRQRGVELVELVVDRDPDRLEGALGRVPAGEARGRGDRGGDRVDELEGRGAAGRARGGGRSRARSARRSAPRRTRAACGEPARAPTC